LILLETPPKHQLNQKIHSITPKHPKITLKNENQPS